MRWNTGRRSDNVEDQRNVRLSSGRMKRGGIGVLLLVLVGMYFGIDPSTILNLSPTQETGRVKISQTQHSPNEDRLADFVSVVLADTEDTWGDLFRHAGKQYIRPKLVLFTGAVQSACGYAQSATGPFYCPADSKVYIDLAFYHQLKTQLKAPGDFAQAYVIAHEIGHHVQHLLGISQKVQARRSLVSRQAIVKSGIS